MLKREHSAHLVLFFKTITVVTLATKNKTVFIFRIQIWIQQKKDMFLKKPEGREHNIEMRTKH